jgi:hypothetical protein
VPQRQFGVEPLGGQRRGRRHQPLAALHLVAADARQRDSAALPCPGLRHGPVLRMQAAHARPARAGHQHQFIADGHATCMHRAGHDGAHAVQREAAVDGQAERGVLVPRRGGLRGSGGQPAAQRRQPVPTVGGHRQHRGAGQRRGLQQRGRFSAHGLHARRVSAIALGHRHRAARHPQQRQHGQVLARLRHHTVVGGDQQQRGIDAGGAGQHGVHQALVAGHVDEADAFLDAGQVQVGVAQLDADAALLLLRQAVGVDTRQRLDQRRLAVVDVACGADDHSAGSLRPVAVVGVWAAHLRRNERPSGPGRGHGGPSPAWTARPRSAQAREVGPPATDRRTRALRPARPCLCRATRRKSNANHPHQRLNQADREPDPHAALRPTPSKDASFGGKQRKHFRLPWRRWRT